MLVNNDYFIANHICIVDNELTERMKELIKSKIMEYQGRAEKIRELLKNGSITTVAVTDTANEGKNIKDDNDDTRKKRMMQEFEGIFYIRYFLTQILLL